MNNFSLMHDIIFLAQKIEQELGTYKCMKAFDEINVLVRNADGEVCGALDFNGFQEYVMKNSENPFLSEYVGLSSAELFQREHLHVGILNYIYQLLKTFEQPMVNWLIDADTSDNRPTHFTTTTTAPTFGSNSASVQLSFTSDDVELQEDGTMVVRGFDPQSVSLTSDTTDHTTAQVREQVAQSIRDTMASATTHRREPLKVGLMIIYNKRGHRMREKWFGLRTDSFEKLIKFLIDLRWEDDPYIIHKVCIDNQVICSSEDLDKVFGLWGINV